MSVAGQHYLCTVQSYLNLWNVITWLDISRSIVGQDSKIYHKLALFLFLFISLVLKYFLECRNDVFNYTHRAKWCLLKEYIRLYGTDYFVSNIRQIEAKETWYKIHDARFCSRQNRLKIGNMLLVMNIYIQNSTWFNYKKRSVMFFQVNKQFILSISWQNQHQ